MTEIAFHVNVRERLAYSCRLLRKAYFSGARVAVTAEPDVLIELDHMLWLFSPTEFVPHVLSTDTSAYDPALTLVLLTATLDACGHKDVLVNLGQDVPEQFEGFVRLIEVVADDHDAVIAGRLRWKHYATRGYSLKKHDRAETGALS